MPDSSFAARSRGSLLPVAPKEALRRALVSGLLTLAALHVPLAIGYGFMQRASWGELAGAGIVPAPEFYAAFPLQWPRLFVLALFAIDVGYWAALFLLLPLEEIEAGPFIAARRRLRRRWLWAHAPVISILAIMLAARLHARALSTSGAGATWFVADLAATGRGFAAMAWIESERYLLLSLAVCFLAHLTLLAGITRPMRWVRNMVLVLALAWALAWISYGVLVPLGDRGLQRAMAQVRDDVEQVCAGAAALPLEERVAAVYTAFSRTSADAPALRELEYEFLPRTVTALPALPLVGATGISVNLEVGRARALAPGWELRLSGDEQAASLPLPDACAGARVLKVDRSLPFASVLPVLLDAGDGPLHLAYRGTPGARLSRAPSPPGFVLRVAVDARVPSTAPRARLPLPLDGALPDPQPSRRDAPRSGDSALLRASAPPLATAPALDAEGRAILDVPADTTWDDVMRALAALALAGAQDVSLVPETLSSSAR